MIATAIKPIKKFFVISETFGSEYFFDKIPESAHITTRYGDTKNLVNLSNVIISMKAYPMAMIKSSDKLTSTAACMLTPSR